MNKILVLIYVIFLFLFFILIKKCSSFYRIVDLNTKIENYIRKNNRNLNKNQYKSITKAIIEQSKYYNIPCELTLALIKIESHFNPKAIGKAGEKGLMQIYTLECNEIKANKNKLFEIEYNISFGLCIFKDKMKITNNDWIKAITLYNGSGKKARRYTINVLHTLDEIGKYFYFN